MQAGVVDRARVDTTKPSADAPDGAPAAPAQATVAVRLFDADRSDRPLDLDDALAGTIGERQLLWIDVEGRLDPGRATAIAKRMELAPRTRRALETGGDAPHISLHGSYFHVRVATEADRDPSESPRWLDLLAAGNVVLTSHQEPIAFLRSLDDRIEADAVVGAIDGAAFVATAVDAAVTSYFRAVDEIEDAVDRLDTRALRAARGEDVLRDLVTLRRRIARLRRALSDEREVFAAFATPDFGAAAADQNVAAFGSLAARYESAMRSVEASRDLLLGSFDVFMTRTAQRTNEVMKVLALATVLLLPGSVIAGLLGMNLAVPVPRDDPGSFWFVVAAILVLAAAVLGFARLRRWI
jgi:magnesium transporter